VGQAGSNGRKGRWSVGNEVGGAVGLDLGGRGVLQCRRGREVAGRRDLRVGQYGGGSGRSRPGTGGGGVFGSLPRDVLRRGCYVRKRCSRICVSGSRIRAQWDRAGIYKIRECGTKGEGMVDRHTTGWYGTVVSFPSFSRPTQNDRRVTCVYGLEGARAEE
jgi:hypothetical protein